MNEHWLCFCALFCLFFPGYSQEIENPDLASLVSDFWSWRLREWPGYGTKYGFHQYDMYLEQYTEQAFTAQRDKASDFLSAASALKTEGLNDQDTLSLAILKNLLTNFIQGYKYRQYSIYNSALPSYSTMLSRMPKNTLADYQNILARYRLIPGQIEDITALLKEEAKLNGTTLYRSTVSRMLYSAEKLFDAKSSPEDNFLYALFNEDTMPNGIDNTTKSAMQSEVLDLIKDRIIPAAQTYITYLKSEYGRQGLQFTRVSPGLLGVEGGAEYYQACLNWHLTTEMSPQQIHETGLKEVERISEKMVEVMQSEGFSGTLQAYMQHLKQDPDNYYTSSEEILQGYEEIIAENHDRLTKVLLKVPDFEVKVVRSSSGGLGSYTEPPLDGSEPGTFNANADNPHEKPIFNMDALTLHEAEPGHHTQTTYAMESGIPNFRKLIEYLRYGAVPFNWLFHTAYTEGWALYAEQLGLEMGAYTDSLKLFGKYNSEMYRAVRLVVDTGIHAYGWSIEEAEQYMKNTTTLGDLTIQREVLRYVDIPGQACAYKIGELKIRELRKEAEDTLGTSFDKRDFHDAILKLGPVSLSIMEEQVHKWMERKLHPVSSCQLLSSSLQLLLVSLSGVCMYRY